ncbi:ASCH domain-containing protein [Aliikangiella sp. G2MR2-5]|uniref:ASCH domain-containing protein n=1 Tax=Aliikangiella sp. G2MR2-5 TaxID=2788943 RepID=UPI0018A9C322|nr:ASCH domain-containing protein [Aliikangiella sp. G2MR2-5]
MESQHNSIREISRAYFSVQNKPFREIQAIHFCDNEKDANECLDLVLDGVKRATATAVWEFEMLDEPLPQIGDLYIVTDWDKVGHCVIQTTKVTTLAFNEISDEHAMLEGEGDKSLQYWQKVHRAYYARQFENTHFKPDDNMKIVFEEFEVVFVAN